MTLCQFILLDEPEQANTVRQGEFLTFREEAEAMVMLYRLHGFYAEVYYNRQTNAIVRLNPFNSRARLVLYFQPCLN